MDFKDLLLHAFKAAEIINSKEHLTLKGMDKIRTIKAGMNKKKDWVIVNTIKII